MHPASFQRKNTRNTPSESRVFDHESYREYAAKETKRMKHNKNQIKGLDSIYHNILYQSNALSTVIPITYLVK